MLLGVEWRGPASASDRPLLARPGASGAPGGGAVPSVPVPRKMIFLFIMMMKTRSMIIVAQPSSSSSSSSNAARRRIRPARRPHRTPHSSATPAAAAEGTPQACSWAWVARRPSRCPAVRDCASAADDAAGGGVRLARGLRAWLVRRGAAKRAALAGQGLPCPAAAGAHAARSREPQRMVALPPMLACRNVRHRCGQSRERGSPRSCRRGGPSAAQRPWTLAAALWRTPSVPLLRAPPRGASSTSCSRHSRCPGDDQPQTLAEWGVRVLSTADPLGKAALTHYAVSRFLNTAPVYYQHLHESAAPPVPLGTALAPARPARPQKPELVPIKQVPTHSQSGLPLNCYLLHTLTHIELNAVDLAWDTVVRFSNIAGDVEAFGERGVVPMQLFVDFLRVADDESRHLGWCLQRLDELGVQYGSIPAHDMLWQGAYDSRDSLAARLAVVPCVQEARGLDAGPRLTTRLNSNNDHRTADIVDRISTSSRVPPSCTLKEEGHTPSTAAGPCFVRRNFPTSRSACSGSERRVRPLKCRPERPSRRWSANTARFSRATGPSITRQGPTRGCNGNGTTGRLAEVPTARAPRRTRRQSGSSIADSSCSCTWNTQARHIEQSSVIA
eukprot:scaffold4488_cov358-Prasinococcus_capsulatus_cf.AAC.2